MGVRKNKKSPQLTSPRRTELLGNIKIDPAVVSPLGGLNPFNPFYDKIGQQFHRLLVEHVGLLPTHRVLDLGCGTGRLAKPLQDFLQPKRYAGLDVNPTFIDYCRETYPSLQFDLCDVRHDEYNSDGEIDPVKFEFPYENRSFDVVIAIALFNHFYIEWAFQYMRQIARVLKPRGAFFGTFLLLNSISIPAIEAREKHPFKFPHRTPGSWHDFETRPLFNVALPEQGLRRVFIKSGLMIKEPIRYGEWCKSAIALTGHDVIIARKGTSAE